MKYTAIELRAMQLWREAMPNRGSHWQVQEPTEPLRTSGGALDPNGAFMKQAVAESQPNPTNKETPDGDTH